MSEIQELVNVLDDAGLEPCINDAIYAGSIKISRHTNYSWLVKYGDTSLIYTHFDLVGNFNTIARRLFNVNCNVSSYVSVWQSRVIDMLRDIGWKVSGNTISNGSHKYTIRVLQAAPVFLTIFKNGSIVGMIQLYNIFTNPEHLSESMTELIGTGITKK